MIQITLRPFDGQSGSPDDRMPRPERPTRAYPNSTASTSSSSATLSQSFPRLTGVTQPREVREELPRPNAPAHDEIYNNRSISPLFLGGNLHQSPNGFFIHMCANAPSGSTQTTSSNTASISSPMSAVNLAPVRNQHATSSGNRQENNENAITTSGTTTWTPNLISITTSQGLRERFERCETLIPQTRNFLHSRIRTYRNGPYCRRQIRPLPAYMPFTLQHQLQLTQQLHRQQQQQQQQMQQHQQQQLHLQQQQEEEQQMQQQQEDEIQEMQEDQIQQERLQEPQEQEEQQQARQPSPEMATEQSRETTELTMAVLFALECPVCRDYATPPIRQCQEGHILCSSCRSRLSVCPECRGNFLSTRARGLEAIASVVDFPCSYTGCAISVRLTERLHHAVTCENRRFPCMYETSRNCTWDGTKDNLISHGIESHPENVSLDPVLRFNLHLSSDERRDFVMGVFDNLFQVVFIVDVSSQAVFGTVKKLGDSAESREFLVTVCFKSSSGDEPRAKLVFSRRPLAETNLNNSKTALVSSALFRAQFSTLSELRDGANLPLSITISRTWEEPVHHTFTNSTIPVNIRGDSPPLSPSSPLDEPTLMVPWGDEVSPSR